MTRQGFDAAYIARLGSEDPETVQNFCAYFGELIHIKARARRLPPPLADDVRQETFLRVLRTLKTPGGLRTAESLGAFVNSVCNNVLFECYRAGAKVQQLAEGHDQVDERGPSVETGLMQSEQRERVREALAALPAREQELLRWLFFEERDKDEICRTLNVDRNYLRVLLHRAKAKFRDRFLADADEGVQA